MLTFSILPDMKYFLDPTERERLLQQHKYERDKRICDRIIVF